MKNIGILFDVSKSMMEKFDSINGIKSINKKSDELINILKNIAKNIEANIFTILFGLSKIPYIADFIKLLQITNNHFKSLETNRSFKKIYLRSYYSGLEKKNDLITNFLKDQMIKKTCIASYRKKFIQLMTKNFTRYCKIEDYIFQESKENDYELLAEFYCNLIDDDPSIVDLIYNSLPIQVTNEEEFKKMKNKGDILTGFFNVAGIGAGIAGLGFGLANLALTPALPGLIIGDYYIIKEKK